MFKFLAGLLLLAAHFNSKVTALPSNSISTSNPTSAAIQPDIVNLVPAGNVAIVQNPTGDTRLYYQDSAGDIIEYAVSGEFDTGHSENSGILLVPASQVLYGSPIAAVSIGNFAQIRVYFFSPDYVLSEYHYNGAWNGGPTCSICLTASDFLVNNGSNVLYASVNSDTNDIRVGFVSSGNPETLSEVDNNGNGWVFALLPN